MRTLIILAGALAQLVLPAPALAFCGTYVAGSGVEIHNDTSQVAIARSGDRTTLTMSSDIVGDNLQDFALLVPVPKVLARDDIAVLDPAVFEQLHGYSRPRLVRYDCSDFPDPNDPDPGTDTEWETETDSSSDPNVEARYIVGEYEIVLLSATDAGGLAGWLDSNGYAVPERVQPVLQEYIDEGSLFLAAKVQSADALESGHVLSPLRISYESDALTVPIRLGARSSTGVQDLIIYIVTDGIGGSISISNYPEFEVENECMWRGEQESFNSFYESQFSKAWTDAEHGASWSTEYSWFGGGCDPCTGYEMNNQLLVDVGWLTEGDESRHESSGHALAYALPSGARLDGRDVVRNQRR
ncbi:MAG: hypothetical protein ACI9MC_003330 [Kiritimatiellia bacterium]|jgi:hypothetical protein